MPNFRSLGTIVTEIFNIEKSDNGKTCYFILFTKLLFFEILVCKFVHIKLKVDGKCLLIFFLIFIIRIFFISKWPTAKNAYSSIKKIYIFYS